MLLCIPPPELCDLLPHLVIFLDRRDCSGARTSVSHSEHNYAEKGRRKVSSQVGEYHSTYSGWLEHAPGKRPPYMKIGTTYQSITCGPCVRRGGSHLLKADLMGSRQHCVGDINDVLAVTQGDGQLAAKWGLGRVVGEAAAAADRTIAVTVVGGWRTSGCGRRLLLGMITAWRDCKHRSCTTTRDARRLNIAATGAACIDKMAEAACTPQGVNGSADRQCGSVSLLVRKTSRLTHFVLAHLEAINQLVSSDDARL